MENIQLVENEVVITNKSDATEYINSKLREIENIMQNNSLHLAEIQKGNDEIETIKTKLKNLL